MNLVSTEWLEKNLNAVKIFDASWHMPSTNRNAKNEYKEKHIKGAIFWDVNEQSIDFQKHARLVIERVVVYGNLKDWHTIKEYYGLKKIKKEAIQIRTLDKKTLNFLSLILNESIQNFRCYKQIQSTKTHWNY